MIKRGSVVRFVGKSKVIPAGKVLMVHDVKDDSAIVWFHSASGKWSKKTVSVSDLEVVVE